MDTLQFPITAADLGRFMGATLIGDGSIEIHRLAPLQAAGEGTLSFFANRKYADSLERAKGAVLITSEALVRPALPLTFLVVEDPQDAFANIARKFLASFPWPGISPQASVHPSARIGEGVDIGPFSVVGENAEIGDGTHIYPHAYIGPGVSVGTGCEIHPSVVVHGRTIVGNGVKIFAGTVIGSDGFGYFRVGEAAGHHEMPQVGGVVIEDDVRIGAKCTVDRGTLGDTRIGEGTKIDDQVHVGHNSRIGKRCLLCGQVGLGGSVVLEDDVILAGQVGIAHGAVIGKGAKILAQSGVSGNVKGDESYLGSPAAPVGSMLKIIRYTLKLPELARRLQHLERRLEGEG